VTSGFVEVAPGIHVLRHPVLDVNVTLIVGDTSALLVDTLTTAGQARELADMVAAMTAVPLAVVNTHHHFDHCFGNAAFLDAPVYAHPEAIDRIRTTDPADVWREWSRTHPGLSGVLDTDIRVPDRPVVHETALDLGGRTAVLRHPGRGHTAGDLIVHVPDAALVVAGDLVEESGPPGFSDAYPLEWPDTVSALLERVGPASAVVPGHGAVVDRAFVLAQHERLTSLAWLIRDGDADGAVAEKVAARSPFGLDASLVAVRRGYDQLAGRG